MRERLRERERGGGERESREEANELREVRRCSYSTLIQLLCRLARAREWGPRPRCPSRLRPLRRTPLAPPPMADSAPTPRPPPFSLLPGHKHAHPCMLLFSPPPLASPPLLHCLLLLAPPPPPPSSHRSSRLRSATKPATSSVRPTKKWAESAALARPTMAAVGSRGSKGLYLDPWSPWAGNRRVGTWGVAN